MLTELTVNVLLLEYWCCKEFSQRVKLGIGSQFHNFFQPKSFRMGGGGSAGFKIQKHVYGQALKRGLCELRRVAHDHT